MTAHTRLARILAPSLLVLAACAGAPAPDPEAAPDEGTPPVAKPWTLAFAQPCVVVADEVWIEGPEDLLSHVAIEQDPLRVLYVTKTTTDGLLQEATLREGVARTQIHARIDGWQIAALERLTVLQRPGEVPVTIRATGGAFWAATDSGEELRRSVLEWKGERPR